MEQITNVTRTLAVLRLLRKNGRMKMAELSKEIGCDDRSVRRYTKTLKVAGYALVSKPGKEGGYSLKEPSLTDVDWQMLLRIQDKLTGQEREQFKRVLDIVEYRLLKSF